MSKIFQIPQFDFKGIKRITIPKLDSDFTESNGYGWDIIKKYLPSIQKSQPIARASVI